MSKIARESIVKEKTASVDQFESSLTELETLIAKMEHGGLSLDESVHSFERGMALYETCKASLDQAQLKGVVGTICGDDTVFVAAAKPTEAQTLAEQLRALAGIQTPPSAT